MTGALSVQRKASGSGTPTHSPAPATPAPATGAAETDPFWFCSGSSPPDGLPAAVRPGLERAFGMELGAVRVHADSSEAAALGAHAFARGADIHFAPGRYDARGGDPHLLAHEVAHVAQQAEGRVSPTVQAKGVDLNDSPALEAEADRMADDAVAGRIARSGPRLRPLGGGVVQGYFQDEDGDEEPRPRVRAARQVLRARAPRALDEFDRLAGSDKPARKSLDAFLAGHGIDLVSGSSSASSSSSSGDGGDDAHDLDDFDMESDIESDSDEPAPKKPAPKKKAKATKRDRSESRSGNDAPKKKFREKKSSSSSSSAEAQVDDFLDEVTAHFQSEQRRSGGLQTAKYRKSLLASTTQAHRDLDRLAWVLERLKASRVCVAIGVDDDRYYLFANEPDAQLDAHFKMVDAAALDEDALDQLVDALVATPSGCRLKKTPENQAKRDEMEAKHRKLVTR